MKHFLLGVELWTPLWAVQSVLVQSSGGSNGKQCGHVPVCLFCCVYSVYNGHMPKIFSFSSLDVKEVANVWQSSKISTLHTLLTYRKDCSVNDLGIWICSAISEHCLRLYLSTGLKAEKGEESGSKPRWLYLEDTSDNKHCFAYSFICQCRVDSR